MAVKHSPLTSLRAYGADGMRVWPLSGALVHLGSAEDCELRAPSLPPLALRLEKVGEGWSAEALDGVPVRRNGVMLATAQLLPGDRLEIGETVLIAEAEAASAAPASSGPNTRFAADLETGLAQALEEFAAGAAMAEGLQGVLEKALERAASLVGATEAFLFTLDGEGKLKAAASMGAAKAEDLFSDSVVQAALASPGGLALPNALADARFGSARSVADLHLATALCVPLIVAGRTTGALYLGSRRPDRSYGEAELTPLRTYAQIVGLLLRHAEYAEAQGKAVARLAESLGQDAGLIAQSPAMLKVLRQADAMAAGDIAVLIRGETGTGKEKLAERLHANSPRADRPFVAVNCSSLKPELLESELFGYKKGAFTGAVQDRPGLFTAAHGGTLFLDELGEMDLGLQAKLLRALESGRIRPVGALQEETVDVRLVCATNRDLPAMVAEKTFREDLYFRVAQAELTLPPLRDREEDIALLAHYFLERFKDRYPAKELRGFHPDSLAALSTYAWPGNVREMQNLVHKGVLLSEGPWVVLELGYGPAGEVPKAGFLGLEEATQRFQRQHLARALELAGGNREQAAKLAQMPRSTFFRYLSQLGISGSPAESDGQGGVS